MKYWLQIATVLTTLTAGTIAAAQDDLAPRAVVLPPDPPPDAPREVVASSAPAVGGEGRWVFDLLGGQLGGPTGALGGSAALGGIGFVGPFQISTMSSETKPQGLRTSSTWTVFSFTPSADVFVTERFSVGAQVEAGIISATTVQQQAPAMPGTPAPPDYTSSMRGTTLGVAPRIGYAFPLSSSVAIWPRLGVGYEVSRERLDDDDARTVMRTFFVESNLGVGIRVSPHVLFDVGPVLQYRRVTSDASSGITTGYFGGVATGSTESFGASVRGALRVDL